MFNYATALTNATGFEERIAQCVACDTLYNYWSDEPTNPSEAYCSFTCECTIDDTTRCATDDTKK